MATPEINENCHYVPNDPHRCKIKLEKFHFDILCCFEVIKESLPGGRGTEYAPPGEIGSSKTAKFINGSYPFYLLGIEGPVIK